VTVAMKEEGLVLVTEDDGSLPLGTISALGLYYHDTQFLSGYSLRINGQAPALLSANTEENYVGAFQLANRPATLDDGTILASQSLSVRRTRFLADGLRERVGILNCNPGKVRLRIELEFDASFQDMFAVRGYRGHARTGEASPVETIPNGIRFSRLGRDAVRRTTDVTMRPAPDAVAGRTFVLERELGPQEIVTYELAIVPREDGAGAAPAFKDGDGYEPIKLINNNPGKHGVSLTSRIAFLPDYAGTSSVGLLGGRDQIYVRTPRALASLRSNHAILGIYGAYADWTIDQWRVIGAGYYVDIQLDRPARDESFTSAYIQGERQLPHSLTAYGRVEDSARMQRSRYVALFDDRSGDIDITLRRAALGLRWDYARRQALSVELTHVVSLAQSAYQARFQWSAAIP